MVSVINLERLLGHALSNRRLGFFVPSSCPDPKTPRHMSSAYMEELEEAAGESAVIPGTDLAVRQGSARLQNNLGWITGTRLKPPFKTQKSS